MKYLAKVNCVAFNEESNVVFSGSMDNTMQVFDNRARTEKPIQVGLGWKQPSFCLTVAMKSGHSSYSRVTGPFLQIFNEATDSVLSIDVNGHEIVAGSADGNYRTYSIRDGTMTVDFLGESVNSVHFTPDGNCVLASTQDGHLRLMDKSNGKNLTTFNPLFPGNRLFLGTKVM